MQYLPTRIESNYFDNGKVVVFIERLVKTLDENKKSMYTIVFDFLIDPRSKINFSSRTNLIFTDKSMMEVSNVVLGKFGIPRESSFYILPNEFIEQIEWTQVNEEEEYGADYLAYKASYNGNSVYFQPAENYQNFIASIDLGNDYLFNNIVVPTFDKIKPNKVKVCAYNVGQGNWNEINFNDDFLIVYDFGSSSSQTMSNLIRTIVQPQVQQLRIDTICDDRKFTKILVISHWDTDHYIGLKSLTDVQLKSFNFCIVPNRIENETTQNVLLKLLENTQVVPIEMNPRIPGGGTSRLTIEYASPLLKMYKGTKCRDRNKRGILLSLHYNDNDFVFPGDHHYNQIGEYVNPNCILQQYNLIVPHHGGHAGDYRLLQNITHGNSAVISTGGRYDHPFDHIEEELDAVFERTHRTDVNGHFFETL